MALGTIINNFKDFWTRSDDTIKGFDAYLKYRGTQACKKEMEKIKKI
ncbi:hypothetical protein phi3396_11 [Streptococcus phage phi3396]|nr:hypothetical protein phi3396_11 [Streptococcus phage phi3396]ABN10784.1 hypothetical protein phi3396_11 [Streptococcus phage phi3396]